MTLGDAPAGTAPQRARQRAPHERRVCWVHVARRIGGADPGGAQIPAINE